MNVFRPAVLMFVAVTVGARLIAAESGNSNASLLPSYPDFAAAPPQAASPVPAQSNNDENSFEAELRDSPGPAIMTPPPLSWTQTVVVRQGGSYSFFVQGYDPLLQPLVFTILPPNGPVVIYQFHTNFGILDFTVAASTAPQIVTIPFQVTGHGVTAPDTFNINVDIRAKKTRVRGAPLVVRSPGDTVKPGQLVRFVWTETGRGEKNPKCEALLTGLTGPAKDTGIFSSTITQVLSVRVRPVVLGYYLMLVTPRDVRGEPARGTNAPGRVFQCVFGTDNLAPVTEGLLADTFLPAVGQTVTLSPNAVDPETAQTVFSNETFDFGDGTVQTGVTGPATHAYASPGIYAPTCTLADNLGATAVAQDNVYVGATGIAEMKFSVIKQIIPDEAGIGELQSDSFTAEFKDISTAPGDRVVVTYNRNRFGRMSAADPGDDTDIILKNSSFVGKTRRAKSVTVTSSGTTINVHVADAQFDRTGDPRLGRSEIKGVFPNQRIAICVIPASGATPTVKVYQGNIQASVKLTSPGLNFIPEETLHGKATQKDINPKHQELTPDTANSPGVLNITD